MPKPHRNSSYVILLTTLAGCAGAMDAPIASPPAPGLPTSSAMPPKAPTASAMPMGAIPTGPAAAPPAASTPVTVAPTTPGMVAPMGTPPMVPTAMGNTSPSAPTSAPGLDPACGHQPSFIKPCSNDPDPCGLKSGFPGDEYCLVPPKEGEGIQIHWGPKDYKDGAAEYIMKPGEEFNNSILTNIPGLSETKYYQHIMVSLRPGSHHWISSGGQTGKLGFYPDASCGNESIFAGGGIGGGQTLISDQPPGGVPAPENVGLGRTINPGNVCMGLHAYNFTNETRLREIWANIWFIDKSKVTQTGTPISLIGALGLNLPAGQSQALTYSAKINSPGRIIQLFGHRHKWTPRFATWLDGKLIYDSWSWEEAVLFNYDSITQNPPINTDGKTDGAVSGMVPFNAGSELKFTCFIENKSDETLRFKNELAGGEMCIQFGTAVGAAIVGQYP